jgi:hypothetical protein
VSVVGAGKIEAQPQFVPVDAIRWRCVEVDIEGLQSMDELLVRIADIFEEISANSGGHPIVGRLSLKGRGPLHTSLCRPNTLRDLLEELHRQGTARAPFIWVKDIESDTKPEIDVAALRLGQDFLGDLLRLVEELRNSPDQMERTRRVLGEFFDNSRASKVAVAPDDALLQRLIDRSETRCIDLLVEDELT